MSFQVRRGVPIPPKAAGTSNAEPKYPLGQLEIGDSLFIPGAKKSVQVTLSKTAEKLGIEITTRTTHDYAEYDAEGNGVGEKVKGIAVWRVAPKADQAAA